MLFRSAGALQISLAALFVSYLISYYTTDSDTACTIFSAVFHYFFLVTCLSLLLMTALQAWQPAKLAVVVAIAIAAQLSTCASNTYNVIIQWNLSNPDTIGPEKVS